VKVSKLFAYTHNHNPKNQHACEAKPPTPQPNSKQNKSQTQKATKTITQKKWHSKNPQPRKESLPDDAVRSYFKGKFFIE